MEIHPLLLSQALTANNGGGFESCYSRSFALPAQSQSPKEAVNWLTFITSEDAQLDWLENTGSLLKRLMFFIVQSMLLNTSFLSMLSYC